MEEKMKGHKLFKSVLSVFLVLCLLCGMISALSYLRTDGGSAHASEGQPVDAKLTEVTLDEITREITRRVLKSASKKETSELSIENKSELKDTDEVTIIVVVDEKSASPDNAAQISSLHREQDKAAAELSKNLKKPLKIETHYATLLNGFSAKVTFGEYKKLKDGGYTVFVSPEFEAIPATVTSNKMIGGGLYNETDYHGEGMRVAILDTGVDTSHEIFADAPESPSLTRDGLASLLDSKVLHAEEIVSGIGADTLYKSEKIPFSFDYGEKDADGSPDSESHGTHVASTAAGNANAPGANGAHGVANQAQIFNMKVFLESGGASYADILTAMEDCILLEVDSVNLSLGSSCGYVDYETEDAFTHSLLDVFDRAGKSGMSIAVAVGNDYSASYSNTYGGLALTSNPDYGNASEPATYDESLAVAAVPNEYVLSPYITVGGRDIRYNDGMDAASFVAKNPFRSLGTGEYKYVFVSGYGEAADYDAVKDELSGNIALVQRGGGVYYDEKIRNAKEAGAVGVVIFNNAPGMLYMSVEQDDPIPSAFISQEAGEYMRDLADKRLTVSAADKIVESGIEGMSDFSSWGATTELTLKPEITAPGEGIYAAVPGNTYESMDGTSMASPHVAGGLAIIQQYLKETHPEFNPETRKDMADTLLMNNATIIDGTNGVPASPRKQGAGLMSITAAVNAGAYVTVPGSERPKLELGDDVGESGEYTVKLAVNNLESDTKYYKVGAIVLTDDVTTYELDGKTYNVTSETSRYLENTFTVEGAENGVISVGANGATPITATIALTEESKSFIREHFENGGYVEGWIVLTPVDADGTKKDGASDMNVPYLAFFGDWTKAPVMESETYYDTFEKDGYREASTYPNTALCASAEDTVATYLGDNNYFDVPYNPKHNAISPNGDDFLDSLSYIYTGLLRSTKRMNYTITGEDGTEYLNIEDEYVPKSVYIANYFQVIPAGVTDGLQEPWFGTDSDGYRTLPNNTKATVRIAASLAYDGHESSNLCTEWSFPITIDTEEPTASNLNVVEREGRYYLDVTVHDNQYVAAVIFYDLSSSSLVLGGQGFSEDVENTSSSITGYDVTGMGERFGMIVDDYAGNSRTYVVEVPGNTNDRAEVKPNEEDIIFSESMHGTWLPEGWTIVHGEANESRNTWVQDLDGASIEPDENYYQEEWLVSPEIDISEGDTEKHLIFNFITNGTFITQYPHCNLLVKATVNGSDWTDLWNIRDDAGLFIAWESTQARVTIPAEFQHSEKIRFAFIYEGKDGASMSVDDVQVYKDPGENYVTINVESGDGGSFDSEGAVLVKKGQSRTFTLSADEGYVISDVKVDGVSAGPISYYTFEQVGVDHTLSAEFAPEGSVAPGGGTGGTGGTGSTGEPQTVFENNFDEVFLPEGWKVDSTTSETWCRWRNASNSVILDGYNKGALVELNAYGEDYNGENQDELLIMPTLTSDLTGEVTLSFRYGFNATNGTLTLAATKDSIADSGNQSLDWSDIWTANSNQKNVSETFTVPEEWCTSGTTFAFRFVKEGYAVGGSGYAGVDDVKLVGISGGSTGGAGGSDAGSTGEPQAIFENDFNFEDKADFPGNDWSVYTTNKNGGAYSKKTWYSGNNTKLGDNQNALCGFDDMQYDDWTSESTGGEKQKEYLITPALTEALTGDATISFDYLFDSDCSVCHFTLIATKDEGDNAPGWTTEAIWSAESSSSVGHADVTIPDAYKEAGARFAFLFESDGGNYTMDKSVYVGIDNVVLTGAVAGGGESAPSGRVLTTHVVSGEGSVTLEPDRTSYEEGESVTVTFVPEEGYSVGRIRKNGVTLEHDGDSITVTMDDSYFIEAEFEPLPTKYVTMFENDFQGTDFPGRGWSLKITDDHTPEHQYSYGYWHPYRYSSFKGNDGKDALHAYVSQDYETYAKQDEWLISPAVDLTNTEERVLTFDYATGFTPAKNKEFTGTVVISVDGGSHWDILWTLGDNIGDTMTEGTYAYVDHVTLELDAKYAVNGAKIAFRYERPAGGDNDGLWAVDNVSLKASGGEVVPQHTITSSVFGGVGGTITPEGAVTVQDGGEQTYRISANDGYVIEDVYVDGAAVGAMDTYVFSDVTGDHDIMVSFRRVVDEGVVFENDFENKPFPFHGWKVDGVSESTWDSFTYSNWFGNSTKHAYISGDATEQDERLVTPSVNIAGAGDAVVKFDYAFGKYGVYHENYEFTLDVSTDGTTWTPIWNITSLMPENDEYVDYGTVEVDVPAEYRTETTSFSFRFVHPSNGNTAQIALDNVSLTTSKTPISNYTITASASQGGKIEPSGEITVREHTDRTFTFTPNEGYEVADVLVDGESVGIRASYTFTDITSDHTISVSFRLIPGGPLFKNDFNTAFPGDGWSVEGINGRGDDYKWHRDWHYALNENDSVAMIKADNYDSLVADSGKAQDERLISPKVDLTGTPAVVTFDYAVGYQALKNNQMTLTLEVRVADGEWNVLWNAADDLVESAGLDMIVYGKTVAVPVKYQANDVQICFRYVKDAVDPAVDTKTPFAEWAVIDNVSLSADDPCESGHTLDEVPEVAATCTDSGVSRHWICTVCGRLFEDEEGEVETDIEKLTLSPLGHEMKKHDKVEPTCTDSGMNEYYYCERCEKYFEDIDGNTETDIEKLTLSPLGHEMKKRDKVEPTCTEDGVNEYYYCERCEKYFEDIDGNTETDLEKLALPALGHEMKKHDKVEPTCTDSGMDEYYYCERCEKYFEDIDGNTETDLEKLTLSPLGHEMTRHDREAPTCTDSGVEAHYYCERCEKYFEDIDGNTETDLEKLTLSPLGHDMEKRARIDPTCTDSGIEAHFYCKRCEKYFEDIDGNTETSLEKLTLSPLGHEMKKHDKVEPTCTENGVNEYYYCERCEKYFEDIDGNTETDLEKLTIPALGHEMKKHDKVEPTCTEKGMNEYYYCERCEKYFEDIDGNTETDLEKLTIPALGHEMKKHDKVEPTCTENGVNEYYYCERCEKYFEDIDGNTETDLEKLTISPLGHEMKKHDKVEPTCTDSGMNEYYYCEHCEKYFEDIDGNTETDLEKLTIPALGHEMKKHDRVEPTCTENGVDEYYYCERCGKYFKDIDGNIETNLDSLTLYATEHDFGDEPAWTWRGDGTVSAEFTCKNDSSHKESVEAAVKYEVRTPATCTESGVGVYTATAEFNGKQYTASREETIAAAGHSFTERVVSDETLRTPATDSEPATYYYTCSECGEISDELWFAEGAPAYTVSGENTSWTTDSEEGLTFNYSGSSDAFVGVKVDGNDVPDGSYTVDSENNTVTLTPDFLSTLDEGDHTLTAVYTDNTAECEFTIVKAAPAPSDPSNPSNPLNPSNPSNPTNPDGPTKPDDSKPQGGADNNQGAGDTGSAEESPSGPVTGDTTSLGALYAMLALSAVAVIAAAAFTAVTFRKKSKRI